MNFLKSFALHFVLALAIRFNVEFSLAQSRCDQLYTEVSSRQLFLENSPLVIHFALNPMFNCSEQVMSAPAKGTTGYDGVSIIVKGTSALVFQYTLWSADIYLTSINTTICATGKKDTWNFHKFQETTTGGYYCLFRCDADGLNFSEFICAATDSSYIKAEKQVISTLAGIPNAASIYDAYSNCPAHQHCAIF